MNTLLVTLFSNVLFEFICLQTVKCFQVFLSNTYNSIQCLSFVRTHLNGFKNRYLTLVILFIKYSYPIQTICTPLCGFK